LGSSFKAELQTLSLYFHDLKAKMEVGEERGKKSRKGNNEERKCFKATYPLTSI
jgi:hypothetical protein